MFKIRAIAVTVGIIPLIAALFAASLFERNGRDLHRAEARAFVERVASDILRQRTEWSVLGDLLIGQWIDGVYSRERGFEQNARNVFGLFPELKALNFIGPDGVIEKVFPERPNQAVLGLDLNDLVDPSVALAQTQRRNETVFVSPRPLVQGGIGIVGYGALQDERGLEGYINVVIDLEETLRRIIADINDRRFTLDISAGTLPIYSWQPSADVSDVVATKSIRVDRAVWTIHATATQEMLASGFAGWADLLRAVGFGLGLLACFVVERFLRQRREIAQSAERFKDYSESGSDWFWEMDENLRFSFMSARGLAALGLPAEKVMGQTRSEVFGNEGDDVEGHLERLKLREPFRNFDFSYRHPAGKIMRVRASGKPCFDENGHFKGYRGVGSDVTSEFEVERRLEAAYISLQKINETLEKRVEERTIAMQRERDRAENAARTQEVFLANISHEIRTPLNGLLGNAELLDVTELDDKQRKFLRNIRMTGNALLAVINEVLDLKKIESGHFSVVSSPVNIRKFMDDTISLLESLAASKGLELTLEMDENLPNAIMTDETRVRQIIFNIVGNAIKFTSEGRVSVRCSTRCETGKSEPELLIEVEDTGIGIPPEAQASIFEQYSQASPYTVRQYGGTGLGLSISRLIARKMGGDITVTSTVGVGSTFAVRLAYTQSNAEAGKGETENGDPAFLARLGKSLAPYKVMVAEDNEVNLMLMQSYFERLNIEPIAARDGAEAVALAEKHQPDIIYMDVTMPKMDGLSATRAIRAAGGKQPVIIALTASAFKEDRQACMDSGMDEFLGKPLLSKDLYVSLTKTVAQLRNGLSRRAS